MPSLDSNRTAIPTEIAPLILEASEAVAGEHYLYAANCFCRARAMLKKLNGPQELLDQLGKFHTEALILQGQAAAELR